jgi:hypothetical protein
MTEIGEIVAVAPPAPPDNHAELELKIKAITDAAGTSIMDGAADFDPRLNAVEGDKRTVIEYETKNQNTFIFLMIRADPTSSAAHRFYRGSNVLLHMAMVSPGTHRFEWDGCSVGNRRLVIEGDYDVILDAYCPTCSTHVEHRATFRVRKAWAHCFGGIYGGSNQLVGSPLQGDYTARANSARSGLTSLVDNTGFDASAFSTESGAAALVRMHEESGVWYWGGHGGPGIISLPTPAGMTAILSDPAVAAAYSSIVTAANCANVAGVPDNALEDVFLIILCGCQTSASPAGGPSLPQALVDKGANIVIGFDLSIFTVSANKWTADFFRFLGQAIGVEDAVRRANRRAATPQYRQRLNSFRILVAPGATRNDKLNPARYGRKQS